MGKKIGRKAITKDDAKGGKKVERKKTVVKQKRQDHQGSSSSSSSPRRSKYVGVTWHKQGKKWEAKIQINGKNNHLGLYHDEKEAARIYDEQAALLGKPVNFPLHEGMEQAVKKAPKGSGRKSKSRASYEEEDEEDESENESMIEEVDSGRGGAR